MRWKPFLLEFISTSRLFEKWFIVFAAPAWAQNIFCFEKLMAVAALWSSLKLSEALVFCTPAGFEWKAFDSNLSLRCTVSCTLYPCSIWVKSFFWLKCALGLFYPCWIWVKSFSLKFALGLFYSCWIWVKCFFWLKCALEFFYPVLLLGLTRICPWVFALNDMKALPSWVYFKRYKSWNRSYVSVIPSVHWTWILRFFK